MLKLPFTRIANAIRPLPASKARLKGPEIVGRKPARAAQRFRSFFLFRHHATRERPLKVISQAIHAEQAPLSHLARLRNFSRNRPEMTNLNHQYAFRRVDIFPVLDAGKCLGSHHR